MGKLIADDVFYMRKALELAAKGYGHTSPNPMVGAILVKENRIIGKGYHERFGGLHAERNAIADCKESVKGATLYVTLEPCCHYGKTPPCTDAILESGISRVVIGTLDPNPLVSGNGIAILRQAGIGVAEGVLQKECESLNEVYFHFITKKKPFVTMKYAMTADGKIATKKGESKWITGEEARWQVHMARSRVTAIMAGIGTVLADDPLFTCRIEKGRSPIRVICDTSLRLPLGSKIVHTADQVGTIIATCNTSDFLHRKYQEKGCEIIVLPKENGQVDIEALMNELGKRKIDSVLLEGGGELNWSCLQKGIVNKIQAFIAPKIFGGKDAKTPIEGAGIDQITACIELVNQQIRLIGDDILIESEVKKCLQES